MKLYEMQKKTINQLIDKYEKSKTFLEENRVNQTFSKKVNELFPKYQDDAEYEIFCDVNESLCDLQQKNLVLLHSKRGAIIERVDLNLQQLDACYKFVKREPLKTEHAWLLDVMEGYTECALLQNYFETQKVKISKNQKVEYYEGKKQDYLDLLVLVKLLCENEEEQFIRDFSLKYFLDSKRVEALAGKARGLMFKYGDFQDEDSVLEECNIVKTPTYVCFKGNGCVTLGGQKLDLSILHGDLSLSTESLKELGQIEVFGKRVVTVENLTSFHDFTETEDFVVYLGGFHNTTKRRFLTELYHQNEKKQYVHFGDIDAGGFYIYEHLRAKTGIPFSPLYMDVKTLQQCKEQTKPLTKTDRKRLERLLRKLNEANKEDIFWFDYRDVLHYMLQNNCKLEQEAI